RLSDLLGRRPRRGAERRTQHPTTEVTADDAHANHTTAARSARHLRAANGNCTPAIRSLRESLTIQPYVRGGAPGRSAAPRSPGGRRGEPVRAARGRSVVDV